MADLVARRQPFFDVLVVPAMALSKGAQFALAGQVGDLYSFLKMMAWVARQMMALDVAQSVPCV